MRSTSSKPLLWAVFIIYVVLFCFAMYRHELWGDEYHSWNIAKASKNVWELLSNIRYEGHPPLWYLILFTISKFTHNLGGIQAVHLCIAIVAVFILLLHSDIPVANRIWMPFGYYLLFEFTLLSRNYAIGLLLAFCICMIIRRQFRGKLLLYYLLLFLLTNTHLLGIFLAGSLHLYFLIYRAEQKEKAGLVVLHGVLGILLVMPALSFVFPPSDSVLNPQFFSNKWQLKQQAATIVLAPLRALMPIPVWWDGHFWNTQFLIDAQRPYPVLKIVNPILSLGLLALVFFILRGNKKSLLLFGVNLLLTFATAAIFPLTSARYVGFIYIGFIVAYWLYASETPTTLGARRLAGILLILQLAGGAIAVTKDIRYPFSNAYRAHGLFSEVPPSDKIVTDYWCLNVLSAYVDKPFYCVDLGKEVTFLKWKEDVFRPIVNGESAHYDGMMKYMADNNLRYVYFMTIYSPAALAKLDPQFVDCFKLELIDKREGAIEKYGDLYLYRVREK